MTKAAWLLVALLGCGSSRVSPSPTSDLGAVVVYVSNGIADTVDVHFLVEQHRLLLGIVTPHSWRIMVLPGSDLGALRTFVVQLSNRQTHALLTSSPPQFRIPGLVTVVRGYARGPTPPPDERPRT